MTDDNLVAYQMRENNSLVKNYIEKTLNARRNNQGFGTRCIESN